MLIFSRYWVYTKEQKGCGTYHIYSFHCSCTSGLKSCLGIRMAKKRDVCTNSAS